METTDELESIPVCRTLGRSGNGSPGRSATPKPMSASLRERLKRTRRSFNNPFAVAKRLKIESEDETSTLSTTASQTAEHADPYAWEDQPCMAESHAGDTIKHPNGKSCTDRNERTESEVTECPLVSSSAAQTSPSDLLKLRDRLQKELREKTEILRRLKMAKIYRSKNDLSQLIRKWRSCSQAALYELRASVSVDGRKPTLGQLIDELRLQEQVLHYDRTLDDFTDS